MDLAIKSSEYVFATSYICARGISFLDRMFKLPKKLY